MTHVGQTKKQEKSINKICLQHSPVRIKEHQTVPSNQIQSTATCFAAKEEHKLLLKWVVEDLQIQEAGRLLAEFNTSLVHRIKQATP